MTPIRLGIVTFLFATASACSSTDGGGGGPTATGSSGSSAATGMTSTSATGGSGPGGASTSTTATGGTSGAGGGTGGTGTGAPDGSTGLDASTFDGANVGDGPSGEGGSGDCTAALPTSLFCDPLQPMPMSIKATGIFPSAPDLTKHSTSLHEYVPDPPLWSDGMEKQRFLLLPPGTKVDNTNRAIWLFPPGTIFIKTFFDDSGQGGSSRAIETRFIRAAKKGAAIPYEFYLYQWNAQGTDATLVVDDTNGNPDMTVPVTVTIKRTVNGQPFMVNGGQPFQHDLPSRTACGKCHEENGMVGQTFIGFDELRLNSKLTPAATKTQLQVFSDAGLFTGPLPAMPATITDATTNDAGRLLRIKQFLFGNCVHCHNGNSVFDLHPDVFVANTVNKATEAQSVVPPPGWKRVVPKSPQTSVLFVQTQRTMIPPPVNGSRLRPMPPVGVADVAADAQAVKDISDWILSL